MGDFLAELLKIFGVSIRSKLITLFTVILLGVAGLLIYERYTASFRLSRLQKETELLDRLQQSQGSRTNSAQEFERARATLVARTVQTIEEPPFSLEFVPSKLTFSMESLWKFLAGSATWFLIAMVHLPKIRTKEGRTNFFGVCAFAMFTGFVGLFIPPFLWPWFHLLAFPWLLFVLILIAILPFAAVPAFRAARTKAQEVNCINNLRMLDAAKLQWALEKGKGEDKVPTAMDLAPYLETFPCCPCGGKYSLGTIGTDPLCSHPGHALHRRSQPNTGNEQAST